MDYLVDSLDLILHIFIMQKIMKVHFIIHKHKEFFLLNFKKVKYIIPNHIFKFPLKNFQDFLMIQKNK